MVSNPVGNLHNSAQPVGKGRTVSILSLACDILEVLPLETYLSLFSLLSSLGRGPSSPPPRPLEIDGPQARRTLSQTTPLPSTLHPPPSTHTWARQGRTTLKGFNQAKQRPARLPSRDRWLQVLTTVVL
ncbi:hypothetical protein ElyMa_000941100 [Elysia marginata]|uniref:Uncharacterized protein n=1 Tax=Elysia marginata TaxID=1093978 RepID=A0AAV4HAJ4_9GAST|nr:hypothetical protein ElyMa_000941100 [Elysia marginata]